MSTLFVLLLTANAPPADAQDTLTAKRDRIRNAIMMDPHVPPQGRHQFFSNTRFFQALGWQNYQEWLYTDDQRFDTDGTFGPVALIAPSDHLDSLTDRDFDVAGAPGILVGVILVDTTADANLPDSYDRLNLSPGRNCIRLRKGVEDWTAYVFPERIGDENPCRAPVPLPQGLRIRRTRPQPAAGARNIPPVARWHEGRRGKKDRMNFGLKCVDHWCIALAIDGDTVPVPHKGQRANERTWETHGWGDVQRLAVLDQPGRPTPGAIKASILPVHNLGDLNIRDHFSKGWVHVATVVVHGALTSPRYAKYGRPPTPGERGYWGYMQGENDIYLKTTTDLVTYPSGWMAEVRSRGAREAHELLVVERHEHAPRKIPGTARFRWMDHDDGDWIRCEDGCCKIGVM